VWGGDNSPDDVAAPSSSAVTPVKAENAEAGAPKPQVAEPKGSVPSTKPVSPGKETRVVGALPMK
jgi:hypothetical protein